MQSTHNPKSTPKGRRATPGRARNAQKVHASDNDVPSQQQQHRAESPSTPRRLVSTGSIAPQTQSTGPKPRNSNNNNNNNKGNKHRNAKNGTTPAKRQQDRESPTLASQDESGPIFAGSTFHASPAPSELPLPSFLSRSRVDSPLAKTNPVSAVVDDEPTSTDSDVGSPTARPVPCTEESPLEFFFRADRAEKARGHRSGSGNIQSAATTPGGPLQASPFQECNTLPKTMPHPSHHQSVLVQKNSSPGMYTSGPQGAPRLPLGPAFSTPYQDRIRAAVSSQNRIQTSATPTSNQTPELGSTEALKLYLFNGQSGQPGPPKPMPAYSTAPTNHPGHFPPSSYQVAQQHHSPGAFRQYAPAPVPNQGSQYSSYYTPGTTGVPPGSSSMGQTYHPQAIPSPGRMRPKPDTPTKAVDALEGDLRRILKLDRPT